MTFNVSNIQYNSLVYDRCLKAYVLELFYNNKALIIETPPIKIMEIQNTLIGKTSLFKYICKLENVENKSLDFIQVIKNIEKHVMKHVLKYDTNVFGNIKTVEYLSEILQMFQSCIRQNDELELYSTNLNSTCNNLKILLKGIIIQKHTFYFLWLIL